MKSFLGFLKENSTLVDEGTFFSEDAAGRFDKKTLEDNIINKNVKLGYYLYFVEYRSISNPNIDNVYFGIKNKRASDPDALPENFFASLRWNGAGYNRKDNIWKRNLLSCDTKGNCPIGNISKDGIYMSSSQPDSSKLGETLSQTYAHGIYIDTAYHPWIMNSKTFKTVQNASGGKSKVLPYESKSGDIAPKNTSEYAYKMYVIEDMSKLDQAFNAALSDSESKVPQEVRKFYEESSKNLKNMEEFLIYYSSEWILGKKGYYETLIKFFDTFEFFKKYPKYKILKTKEFDSLENYITFFKEQLKKNKWALIGTFEAYASRFMEDLLTGKLTTNPYVDDKNHYMKDKTFQKPSSQIVVALDSYGWGDLYFPENTMKQIIPIEEIYPLYDTESWIKIAGKGDSFPNNKELDAAGGSTEKATINALKQKYGKGFTIADMFSFYYSGGKKIGKRFKDSTDEEKGKVLNVKTKTLIPISDKNKKNLLKILQDKKNIEKYKDDVLKIQKDFLYNLEFLKRNSTANYYEEIKLVVENNIFSNLLSNYLIEARKEVQGYYESGNIKNYNLKDFLADIFEIKGLPKNLTVDGLLKTRIKNADGKESTVLQILKDARDKILSGEMKVNVADSYEPNKDAFVLLEEKNKIEAAAIGLASNIIKSENSPHGHMYFDFNDKVTYLGKSDNLKEDKNDDGFMKLKKLIIGGTKLGSQHNNIFKR